MKRKINNGIFYVVISLVAILGVASFVIAYSGYTAPKYNAESGATIIVNEAVQSTGVISADESLGATSGTDFYQPIKAHAGFGGEVYATSTISTSETITEGLLERYSIFEITPLVSSLTWTLPATSTLSTLLKNEGDTQRWVFQNATSTATTLFTLAAGTGWNLIASSSAALTITGAASSSQASVFMDCYRGSKTGWGFNITCKLEEGVAAD